MSKKGDNSQKNQRIQVFARCRPLNSREKSQGSPSIVEVIPEKKEISVKDRNSRREFFFDKVFSSETKQITVYKSVVEPLIQEVLMGYNCTVFAYGQTGTGKTYTMEGERNNTQCSWEDDPGAGIIPRSLHQLFEELNKGENVEFCVRVSFLELYNEELFDLLGSTEFSKLRLYEDPIKKGSVIIQNLEEIPVNSKDEVYTILERGTARRQTAATMLNATSSRSHTVFSVTVHLKENTVDGEELLKTGKLNLVDLAGSENVGRSGAVDKRAREAGNINQSLLTLGRVITALIEKQPHVPYRESKLTRLLQDSLGGHTKTSIIATISPAQLNLDETVSTLDYATKAKSITIKPEANQKMTKRALIKEYSEEIERLKKDLVALRSNDGFYVDSDNYMNMMKEINEKGDVIKELQDKLDILKEEKESVDRDNLTTREELFKRTQQYEEMSLKLAQTSQTLSSIKKRLAKIALERDETEHLLNVHCNTEKILSAQAQKLLKVAHQTTDDVNKLHEKIERKQKVEQTNEERAETFKIMYQKQFARLDDMVSEEKSQQLQKLKDIRENLNELSTNFGDFRQKFTDVLHIIDTNQNNSLEQFSLSLSNDTSNQKKWSDSTLEDLKSKKGGILTEQQTFLTETFPGLVDQLHSLQLENETYFVRKHEVLCKKIEELHSTIKSDSENKLSLIRTVHTQLNSFHDHHEALLKELDEKSKSLETLMEEDDESFEKEKEKLYLQLDNLCKSRQKGKNKLKEKLSEVQSSSISLNNDCTKLKLINEPLNMLQSLEGDSKTQLIALGEITNTFEIDEFTLKQTSASDSLKSMSSEVTNFLQNSQEEFISAFNGIENAISTNVLSIQDNFDRNEKRREEITSSISEKVQHAVTLLEKQSRENVGKISSAETDIDDSKQQLNLFTEQLKKEILQRDLEFEKFIYEDLQKDIPTGMTPQRKSYEYPTDLAVTSPDEKILQRVRSFREGETKIAVTLALDSSFEDHDEFKSPINQDTTESTVVNTSFTDDENLTGCDTESNASSMSDLSIDGLKNKENWNFAKPSHLPKLKKLKKLPKPSSIKSTNDGRKPLYSKNP